MAQSNDFSSGTTGTGSPLSSDPSDFTGSIKATPVKLDATRMDAGDGAADKAKQAIKGYASDATAKLRGETDKIAGQATERAKEYARDGKGKATETIASLARYVEDNAAMVDERFGAQYGDYARNAATSISKFADKIEDQDVDQLVDNTRDFIRKSPALAIGAAAIAGFLIARLVRGSGDDTNKVRFTPDSNKTDTGFDGSDTNRG